MEEKTYCLGHSTAAARRLELQDRYFHDLSDQFLDKLALRSTDTVIELGCGPGSFSHRILRRLGKGGVLRGVDSSERLLAEAQTVLAGIGPARFEPVSGDAAQLGSWFTGADAVVGRFVLHHIPMAECLLGRLRTVLRPGAKIAFLEPDPRTLLGHLAYVQATQRSDLMPLLVWTTTMNQLFLSSRVSPDVGATMGRTLERAGYRNVRSEWFPNPLNALMIENMSLIYDEIRDTIMARGILSSEEITEQQSLLRMLSLEGAPPVWGSFSVICEV